MAPAISGPAITAIAATCDFGSVRRVPERRYGSVRYRDPRCGWGSMVTVTLPIRHPNELFTKQHGRSLMPSWWRSVHPTTCRESEEYQPPIPSAWIGTPTAQGA